MSAESGSAPLRAQSNPTPLRIGSLCTGYGGLDMAVQRVFGGQLAWVSDVDPGASRILAHHWPAVPNLGDLTTTRWDEVEPVDVVCGGYPCQPFSSAGLRKGTQDERHIWPYIADALRVLRPRYAIFENVANHLRLGFADVLADLARLGFDAEWCLVRASEVGAPHPRKRLFLLAVAQDAHGAAGGERGVAAPGQAEGRRARADARGRGGAPVAHADRGRLPGDQERHRGPEDGQPERAPRMDADGRGIQRATAADAARLRHGDAGPTVFRGLAPALVGGGPAAHADTDGGRGGADEHELRAGQPDVDWGRFLPAVRRWEAVTGRHAPWATDDRGRLSPLFVEWLMGLPAGHVTAVPGLSRAEQLKALGNGVVPQQAAAALRLLVDRADAAA